MQPGSEHSDKTSRNNRRVVFGCLVALSVMGGITAYSPTLYRMFCSLTGYGGTTQRAESHSDKVLDRTMTVRFDSNIAPHLAWKFEPDVTKMDVKIGETSLAYFRVTNLSDKSVTGQAAFNVTPEIMGIYFKKIACFCFNEQTLKPHETVEMPVTFFIDPKMVEDSDAKILSEVTLSYIFYPVEHATADNTAQPAKSGG
ncbi:cytochrome C oxidase assembly protein CtaG/Cox11 [Hyphomicrobium denitrificans 1NES1]|uniref:Cytochrome c oxidase assembly protein CtaG n=1 Tax=Hyphomicrobium denitrificans 1NES1 TaxID=670307 RepID=N0BGL3_9HYPH|nr:cytochrome c oxidase assembly protein [Hyphomicrobium denitrificans]AGK59285.1 cytochrome C oxidase assembly protein CtaG/Cox11 [Hyphomicrobium denitrificans 1NES1]